MSFIIMGDALYYVIAYIREVMAEQVTCQSIGDSMGGIDGAPAWHRSNENDAALTRHNVGDMVVGTSVLAWWRPR
jgi:hypothetical protein